MRMVVEDDLAFLNRFCKIVASDIELEAPLRRSLMSLPVSTAPSMTFYL